MAARQVARARSWQRRHHDIAVLARWYARSSDREAQRPWRRRALRAGLLLGPVLATAGALTLLVAAFLAPPVEVRVAALAGALIVWVATSWRTATALVVAAGALGMSAVVLSYTTELAAPSRAGLAVTLIALAGLVAAGAIVMSVREPPRFEDLPLEDWCDDPAEVPGPVHP